MSDALNLIALAKMAVIVIGIFLVPIITRKFAADLGVPVGQMAMDRAALAGSALGLAGLRLGWAATQGARSAGTAAILSPIGSRVKNAGANIQEKTSQQNSMIGKKVGAGLEKFGGYLEQASVRHQAKKQGVEPPSLTDKVKKAFSADPRITAPIVGKEQRYQSFVRSNVSQNLPSPMAGSSTYASNPSHKSVTSVLKEPASPFLQSSVSQTNPASNIASSLGSNSTRTMPTRNMQNGNTIQGRNIPQENVPTQNSKSPSFTSRVKNATHRWRNSSRINRLFESNERKPS